LTFLRSRQQTAQPPFRAVDLLELNLTKRPLLLGIALRLDENLGAPNSMVRFQHEADRVNPIWTIGDRSVLVDDFLVARKFIL